MKEALGSLWTYPADWRVVTTNGYVTTRGVAAMSAGCALEATVQYPGIDKRLAERLLTSGNNVYMFREYKLITFPVKQHWSDTASLELIKRSVDQLWVYLLGLRGSGDERVVMPRPGCGYGRQSWEVVRPLLEDLPDTVTVITFDNIQTRGGK